MPNERHIICGSLSVPNVDLGETEALRLTLHGPGANARLKVADLTKSLVANIPDAFLDLIELATYVYVTDQAVSRGTYKLDDMQPMWRRRLIFDVPVRCCELWRSDQVVEELTRTLGFLSDDEYEFRFHPYVNAPSPDQYFPFSDVPQHKSPERVVLFSGGLDSLAGAIREVVLGTDPICLLTHEPSPKFRPRQRLLRDHLDDRASGPVPLHVTIRVNKAKELNREYTQRTRSFLYASLAAAVARMAGLRSVRFYENGVVSINLPLAADVVGGRATRTTHPYVLNGFGRLFSLLADEDTGSEFKVENGFLDKTKADVVRMIVDANCASMIETSTSCTHTWTWTRKHTHCGVCSQCIDRRFAILAAGAREHDPAARYKADLFLSPRPKDEDRRMVACYVEMARLVGQMTLVDLKESFGGIYRVAGQLPGTVDDNVAQIFDLYKRHGNEVAGVVADALAEHNDLILNRTLPANSLLQLVHDLSIPAEGMISASTSTKTDDEVNNALFVFRRAEQTWKYRFEKKGPETKTLLPSKGASYLHVLLSNPEREFSVASLVLEVAKAPQEYQFEGGDEVLDETARKAIWSEYQEIQQRIDDAVRKQREGEAEQLRKEQEQLLAAMNEAGFLNRPKKLGDDRDRHRKSFSMAITRVIKQISEFDEPFAEHLRRCLKRGRTPCYRPPESVAWVTT